LLDGEEVMMPEPKRKWFAYAFFGAWVTAAASNIVQSTVRDDAFAVPIAILGTPAFPLGLPSLFISSPSFLVKASLPLIAVGWLILVGLGAIGAWRKSLILFLIFAMLLLANVGGCVAKYELFEDALGRAMASPV
jgi:hypothetical protein